MFHRFITCAVLCVAAGPAAPGQVRPAPVGPVAGYGRIPITFEQNTGRYDHRVRFLARTGGGTLFLTDREAVLSLSVRAPRASGKAAPRLGPPTPGMSEPPAPSRPAVLRMKLAGSAGAASAMGLQRQPGVVNYFIGNDPKQWRTRVPTFARVKMAGVYPGIDLVYYGGGAAGGLEYDFVVKPGSDPGRIRLAFSGARKLAPASNGDLIANTEAGDIRIKRPYAYQQIGGKRVQVACGYTLRPDEVGIRVAHYDAARPLVVDPVLITEYATYLGGRTTDEPKGIRADASGSAVIVGTTWSPDFPTPGGYATTQPGGTCDLFIARLNAAGTAQVYGTYFGGSGTDTAAGVALGQDGSVYFTATTDSPNLPTPGGAYTQLNRGNSTSADDAFVGKLSASGDAVLYGTYIGGGGDDDAVGVAVDAEGCAYTAGNTYSRDFPTVAGSYRTSWAVGGGETYACKLNPQGSALAYSTYLTKYTEQWLSAICVDAGGSAAVAGTAHEWDTLSSRMYAYAVKLDPAGSTVLVQRSLGGRDAAYGKAVAIDAAGAVYLAGYAVNQTFGIGDGAYTTFQGGVFDAFVQKYDAHGSTVYGTYLGGSDTEQATGIAVGSDGKAFVVGYTLSPDFPAPGGAVRTPGGHYDGFLAVLTPRGDALQNGTYLGGSNDEWGFVVDVDGVGAIYVAGCTASTDVITSPGAPQPVGRGGYELYAAKLRPTDPMPSTLTLRDAAGRPGSSTALEARFATTAAGWPVAGRKLAFTVASTAVGSMVTDEQGVAALPFTVTDTIGMGALPVRARFPGDADYTQAEGAATLTVTPAPTFAYTVDRYAVISEPVLLKAWLKRLTDNAWLAGRTVTFAVAGTRVGSATAGADGMAVLEWIVSEASGPQPIEAAFAGAPQYEPSVATALLVTAPVVGTTLTVPDRACELADSVLLKAYLRRDDELPVEYKVVTFHVDGSEVGAATTNYQGRAMLEYTVAGSLAVGRHDLEARWAGNGGYLASSGQGALQVSRAPAYLWFPSRSIKQGGAAYLRSYLRRLPDYVWLPGKTVGYKLNGTALGSEATDAGGRASLLYTAPPSMAPGDYGMTATFGGDATYQASGAWALLSVVP
ncbi:MAG: hypothetical protein NT029_09485 [Armatimonadetes bacterium]|nr:hypothetical protein [Armatimonadota bacterium]